MIYPENKILCINSKILPGNEIAPMLTEGCSYVAKHVIQCKCGETHINVGLESTLNYISCYKCRQELPDKWHWCHSSRFTKQD